MTKHIVAAVALTSFCLSACVAPPAEDFAGPGGPRPPGFRGGPPQPLFISPSGTPYRSEPEASAPKLRWFAQADADGDGALSRSEFQVDARSAFGVWDVNGDGVIDSVEVSRYEREVVPEILDAALPRGRGGPAGGGPPEGGRMGGPPGGGMGGGGGGPGGGPGGGMGGDMDPPRAHSGPPRTMEMVQGAAVFGLLDEPEPLRAADADLSWRVTAAEWDQRTLWRFQKLDRDGDGQIVLAELPATPSERLQRFPR